MFENNGFAFDTVGSFFGESTTPEYDNGFSNTYPSDNFFSESAFDEMGFSNPETSVFSESVFDENGFSSDMFCESNNEARSFKIDNGSKSDKDDYISKLQRKRKNKVYARKGEPGTTSWEDEESAAYHRLKDLNYADEGGFQRDVYEGEGPMFGSADSNPKYQKMRKAMEKHEKGLKDVKDNKK